MTLLAVVAVLTFSGLNTVRAEPGHCPQVKLVPNFKVKEVRNIVLDDKFALEQTSFSIVHWQVVRNPEIPICVRGRDQVCYRRVLSQRRWLIEYT